MTPAEELQQIDLLIGYFHGRKRAAVARAVLMKLRGSIYERSLALPVGRRELLSDRETALKAVAKASLDFDRCVNVRRNAEFSMSAAYDDWKQDRGITTRLETGSGLFSSMLSDTAIDYAVLQRAKRDERNARRRMENAVLRYRKIQVQENPALLKPSLSNGGIV